MADSNFHPYREETRAETRLTRQLEQLRLSALAATELLDTAPEDAFDRLTSLVQRFLDVPVSLVSLVDSDRQFFKSAQGLPEPWATLRQTPLSHSFCKHVVASGEPLIVADALSDPLVCGNPAVEELDVKAYLGVPLRTPDGYVLGSLCAIDTAEHVWAEKDIETLRDLAALTMTEIALRYQMHELRENEERFRKIFEEGPIGMALVGTDNRFTRVNEALCRMLGYRPDELVGRSFADITHPDDLGADLGLAEKVFRGEIPSYRIDKRYIKKSGEVIWTRLAASVVRTGRDYQASYGVAIIEDVSAQRQAAQDLEAAKTEAEHNLAQLETVLESISDALFIAREDGTILGWNQAAIEMHAIEEIEPGGVLTDYQDAYAFYDLEGRRLSVEEWPLARALAGETFSNRVLRVERLDNGYTFVGSYNGSAVLDEEGAVTMAVVTTRDVTEQKAAEETLRTRENELKQLNLQLKAFNETLEQHVSERTEALHTSHERLANLNEQLETRNRELQDFAYVASHDLQEPLRKIRTFADLLVSDVGDALDAQHRHFLTRMQDAAGRMSGLIADLLAFSRVQTKRRSFEPVDLNEVLGDVLSDLELRLHETGGRVEAATLPTIDADATQMHQLLLNLVGNGLKFHRADSEPLVRVDAETAEAPSGEPLVRVRVSDNGIGFEAKYLDRIFTPFQRLHGRSEYEGSGIGLAICRRIAERHGGGITAEGKPGEGATFTVTLPLRQAEEK